MVPWISLGEIVAWYEVILFDSDGVLARWPSAVPEAPEVVARLNSLGKPYFVLTNDASALPETRSARYAELGLAIDAGKIISSGLMLKDYFRDLNLAGSRCVVLGTEDSASYVQQAGGEVVSFEKDFDVLVIGDQEGFPFVEATGKVLSNLFLRIDRGEMPYLVGAQPRRDLSRRRRLQLRQRGDCADVRVSNRHALSRRPETEVHTARQAASGYVRRGDSTLRDP